MSPLFSMKDCASLATCSESFFSVDLPGFDSKQDIQTVATQADWMKATG